MPVPEFPRPVPEFPRPVPEFPRPTPDQRAGIADALRRATDEELQRIIGDSFAGGTTNACAPAPDPLTADLAPIHRYSAELSDKLYGLQTLLGSGVAEPLREAWAEVESQVQQLISALVIARDDAKQRRGEYERACALVASMHAAAVGEVRGPIRGVVEDVEDVRRRLERAHLDVGENLGRAGAAEARADALAAQADRMAEQLGQAAVDAAELAAARAEAAALREAVKGAKLPAPTVRKLLRDADAAAEAARTDAETAAVVI